MHEQVFISRSKNKAAAKLERIFAQLVLFVSGGLGTLAGLHVVAAQKMEQGSVLQLNGFVGFALFVDQEREVDAGFLAEELGIAHIAQANGGQAHALPAELLFMCAQLRDVLTAEDSAVMAKKDHSSRTVGPQRAEADHLAVNVRKGDAGQLAAESIGHAGDFQGWRRWCQGEGNSVLDVAD